MDIERIRQYSVGKKGVTEHFPFDEVTLVFKAGGKSFLFVALDENPLRINLKCDPGKAVELRERYPAVTPGYHMNKKHWNTICLNGSVEDDEILSWIDDSYQLVTEKLTKKVKKKTK